jgi:K+-sensing histidine kinase KdpD
MELARAPVSAAELLTDARRAALDRCTGGAAGEPRFRTEGDLDSEVVVDRERLVRALGALLAFAMLRPGSAGTVSIGVRLQAGHGLELSIRGDGTTPTREVLVQLFDPFDFAPSGARAPAGLGLAVGVARQVIELHGGTAQAEASEEGGLLLRVHLPGARSRLATVP